MTSPSPQPRLPALCPYCGHGHELSPDKPRPLQCESCKGRFEPLSRQATQNAMGPWQIRDPQQPFRPPCSYDTIARLAQRGRITLTTIVRGPTTRQFWAYARDAPGVAAILGLCHSCHTAVSPDDRNCPSCEAVLRPATDRQQLGLSPVAALPGEAPPEQIAALIRPRTPAAMPTGQPPAAQPDRPEAPAPPSTQQPPADAPTVVTPDALPDPPARRTRRRRAASPALLALVAVQGAAILLLGSILLFELGVFNLQSPSPQAGPDATPPATAAPGNGADANDAPGSDPPAAPSTDNPADEQPTPQLPPPPDLATLMDESMRPYADRYWRIVEATRADEADTLARAVDQLRALRAEAAAADPDAAFPLTDDLITMAQERLDQLRLLEQFENAP